IGHLAARATEAGGASVGAHQNDNVPARLLAERAAQWRDDLPAAGWDPPVEVAAGVAVDVIGGRGCVRFPPQTPPPGPARRRPSGPLPCPSLPWREAKGVANRFAPWTIELAEYPVGAM